MSKWILAGCPRCHGDMYIEQDNDDCYERCLQCGYVKQIAGMTGMYGKTGAEQAIDQPVSSPH